jgi:hypothetical protein
VFTLSPSRQCAQAREITAVLTEFGTGDFVGYDDQLWQHLEIVQDLIKATAIIPAKLELAQYHNVFILAYVRACDADGNRLHPSGMIVCLDAVAKLAHFRQLILVSRLVKPADEVRHPKALVCRAAVS